MAPAWYDVAPYAVRGDPTPARPQAAFVLPKFAQTAAVRATAASLVAATRPCGLLKVTRFVDRQDAARPAAKL